MVVSDGTKTLASTVSRGMFYPSLLYNLARYKLQGPGYAWWTKILGDGECSDSDDEGDAGDEGASASASDDECDEDGEGEGVGGRRRRAASDRPSVCAGAPLLLGALPFPSDVQRLARDEGVRAVVTLNEPFEVMVTPEEYERQSVAHLHIPTVDYLFAPDVEDTERGVRFIAQQRAAGNGVYVHCKAGRGRSTTLVLCYLVSEGGMEPADALRFVKAKRPQVKLATAQWAAVLACHQRHNGLGEGMPTDVGGAEPATPPRASSEAAGAPLTADTPSSVRVTRHETPRVKEEYVAQAA